MHPKKSRKTILLVCMRPSQGEKDFLGGDNVRVLSVIILVIDDEIWENKYLRAKINKKFTSIIPLLILWHLFTYLFSPVTQIFINNTQTDISGDNST